ncbi:TetR/AcrR family transcriptional regulator [Anaerovibrio lipolyticus]|uniref:TetR/AcrR family transcriptional regulator n=1 Tax=Anaerovibrio lipolyticus TaxID=82374 RepID=UPI0026EAD221|nr:TetR/AcrR family transcriptional regulator [Anaerovibrio lipolyticus]MBE6106761.1 TetR/AcrR family transcriptional regulator [Anaerovibrio lipolyticus]
MVIIRRTNTKERILEESLKLFSNFGYNAVGVEMIAAAVKVTPPSLYKHFKGKREILDTIIEQAEENYNKHSLPIINFTDEQLKNLTKEEFIKYNMDHVKNIINDNVIKCVRKLLILEQFRNEQIRLMHIEKTYTRTETVIRNLLEGLFRNKHNGKGKPEVTTEHMVNMFYLPIIAMINRCYSQPEYEKKALKFIEDHIGIVWDTYFE